MGTLRAAAIFVAITSCALGHTPPQLQAVNDVTSAAKELQIYRKTLVGTSGLSEAQRALYLEKIGYLQKALGAVNDVFLTTPTLILHRAEQDFQQFLTDEAVSP